MKTIATTRLRNSAAAGFLLASAGWLATTTVARASEPKAAPLNIGDPAPLLQPAKWVKGAAIPAFEKGHVYVVEFWATWCGPCKANIPRLTEMAKKYKGKAEIIGVDIWESPDPSIKTLPKVESFVKAQGAHMDYHIAADATTNVIANSWMKPAGENGIPTAFIIGKDGKIAWIGNPATGLDEALPQVIDDKFDIAAAKVARQRLVGPTHAIDDAFAAKDYAGALKLVNAKIAEEPANEGRYAFYRFLALAHTDLPDFEKRARQALTDTNNEIGTYQMLCSIPASNKDLSPDAYKFGRTLVDEALLKKDREYMFYAMGAEMDSQLGDKAGAVTSQEAAIKAAEADTHCPPDFLVFLRKNLDVFKAANKG